MAKSPDQALQSLRLSAEEVRRQNPKWSDEMVMDYIGHQEDIISIAQAVSKIVFPMIIASLQRDQAKAMQSQSKEIGDVARLVQQVSNQQSIQLVQSIQQQAKSAGVLEDGYAKLTLSSFTTGIPAGSSEKVTGMSNQAKGFAVSGERITSISGGFVRVSIYAEVDTDTADYVNIQVRKNGSTIEESSVLSAGGAEYKPVCLTFEDTANKNNYYEIYIENPAGAAIVPDIRNIIFSAGY